MKCLPFRGAEINFGGRVCETKIIFFCILERVKGVYGKISMNPNDQCRLCTFVFLIRLKQETMLLRKQAAGSRGQIPVNKNRLSPMQTVTELPRMEVQLPEFDYSNTVVRRNSFKERPAGPPQSPLLQETRGRTRARSFRPRGSAGENLRNKYLEHVLPDND